MSIERNTTEDTVENFLDKQVIKRGGFTIKLDPHRYKGIPDRLVVLPGRIFFVEVKRPVGGVVAKLQSWWRDRIRARHHGSYIARTEAEVLQVLDAEEPSD